jgi:hypothetical protein
VSLRYGVLSLFVFFAIFFLVLKNYETWTLPVEVLPEKGATKKSVEKIESPSAVVGQKEPTDIQSYIFVSEKNIFSPERKEFPIIAPPPAPAQVKPPIVRPQIVLYGVTLAGDYQSASIVNPGRPRTKGEREVMGVKVGDQIGEFKVAKILPDRIMMEAAGDSFEVLLYDPRTPKQRTYAKTEARPATVTSTFPPGAPLPAAVPSPAVVAPVPSPAPITPQPMRPTQPTTPSSRLRREVSPSGQLPSSDVSPGTQMPQTNVPPQSGAPGRALPVGPL